MLARVGPAHVPLAEVRRGIAGALQHLGDGRRRSWELERRRRRDELAVLAPPPLSLLPSPTNVMCSWAGLCPVKIAARDGVQRGDGA